VLIVIHARIGFAFHRRFTLCRSAGLLFRRDRPENGTKLINQNCCRLLVPCRGHTTWRKRARNHKTPPARSLDHQEEDLRLTFAFNLASVAVFLPLGLASSAALRRLLLKLRNLLCSSWHPMIPTAERALLALNGRNQDDRRRPALTQKRTPYFAL
jgi:hypothetical protein